ncbi:Holliday junction resolvase [Chlamydia trachomatis]|nr:Holliday junction resolvase [Chlamydia trachomatis]
MRILGVDPGLTRCGLGIIEADGGRRVKLVDVDVARSKPELPPGQRLLIIYNKLEETIRLQRPHAIAFERVFAQENVRSVMSTAQVAGIVLLIAAQHGIPIASHSPSEVKAAVTGNGRAEKLQVQTMVQRILNLPELPRPKDAADALAIAICHAWRGGAIHIESDDATRAQHGGAGMLPRAEGVDLTPAQKMWAQATRLSTRHGAVAPKK